MIRLVRSVAVILFCCFAINASAQNTLVIVKQTVAPDWTDNHHVAFPGGEPILSVTSATVVGGSIFIAGGNPNQPNPVLECFFTVSGAIGSRAVQFVVQTASGPQTWTGSVNVQPLNNPPNFNIVQPDISGGQVTATSSPLHVQGVIFGFNGTQVHEILAFNPATNTTMNVVGVPNLGNNTVEFAFDIALAPGQQSIFVHVSDVACGPCNGTLVGFGVEFSPDGGQNRPLNADYIGPREAFHNEACVRRTESFGGGADTSTGCPPLPPPVYQMTTTAVPPDDGVNFSGGGGCGSYWHLQLMNLPGRGLPLVEGISYNSNISLGPNGYILGKAPWSTWWTQRVLPGAAGSITRFDGKRFRTDMWTDRGDGLYITPEVPGALRIEADGTMALRMRGGHITHYRSFTDPVAPGAVYRVDDPHANDLLFEYEATTDGNGRLKTITDTYGAIALTYTYRPTSGLLDRFTDLTGREVVFDYSPDPSPTEKLIGVRSPVGPEFPAGRRFAFGYVPATVLLARVVYPNEIEAGLDEARVEFVYDGSGCVTAEKLGGTNASGIAAGGWITTVRGTRDGHDYSVITDRRGLVTEYDYDSMGRVTKKTELTSGIRTTGPYVTTWSYNADGYGDTMTLPEGNSVVTTYRASPNPFQRGDVLEVRRFAGPRGATQAEIAVRFEYEALFNKVAKVEDPRFVDPGFVPPLGSKAHMVTRTVFEYQEGAGVPPREAGWGISAAELVLNEPDRNGNGLGASGCSTVQAIFHPSTTLPGGAVQTRTSLFGHNLYGQLVFEQDPGGVRATYEYHSESDVDGSGAYPVPGGDAVTGGFRKAMTRDTIASIYGAPVPITTKVAHNRIGDVVRTIDGRGVATTYVPNEVHLVREIIAASDTSEQPGQRNETEVAPALSIRTIFTRDANDNAVKVEVDNHDNNTSHDGAFIERRVVLDILDMPLSTVREVTETESVEATLRYDANQNLVSTDDNQVPHTHTRTTYDERNIVFESFRGQGAEEAKYSTEVDLNGNVTEVISPVDRIKQAGASSDGQLDRVTRTYDGHDRARQLIDGLGNLTSLEFDPASQVTIVESYGHPAGDTAAAPILLSAGTTTHDEAGRIAVAKSTLFVDSATAGTLANPAVLDTDDDVDTGNVTITAIHDVNNLRTAVRIANRAKGVEEAAFTFDGHRRVVSQTDAEGNRSDLDFDNNDQLVRLLETDVQPEGEIGSEAFESSMVRDALGRVVKSKDPKNAVRKFEWGTLYMKRVKDALDNITRTRRDGLGRVIRTKRELTTTGLGGAPLDTSNPDNPDGVITTISGFDDAANQTRLEDDRGNETRYDHDSRGNVETTTFADGTIAHSTFDLGDAAIGVTDQAGNVFTNSFDPLGRLVQTDIARASGFVGTTQIVREFDGLSRLTYTRDNGGEGDLGFVSELQMRYDSLGNMLEEIHNGRVVGHQFKSFGDPVAMVYPDGTRLEYQTDRLSRLTELEEDGESEASWKYIGQRTHRRAWGNGTTTTYAYDNNRRLKRLKHKRGGTTFLDFEVGYNAEDFLTHEIRHHRGGSGLQVNLDSAYRVKNHRDGVANPAGMPAAGATREEAFTLDGVGNWNSYAEGLGGGSPTTLGTAINEMNEYTQFGADPQAHNDNGDRTLDDRHTYEWDALGRLRVVKEQTTGDVIARHSYHADGRRTRKEEGPAGNGNRTLFVWDGPRMVEESRPNGVVRATTVWGRGWEQIKYATGGQVSFFHRDASGWIAAVTKKNGKVHEQYRYSSYGKVTFLDGAGVALGAQITANPWLWHGYYRDTETAHYYAISRFCDPNTGRWISRDPAGYADGLNGVSAFGGNPFHYSDPFGTEIRVGDVETIGGKSGAFVHNIVDGEWRFVGVLWTVKGKFTYNNSLYERPVQELTGLIERHGAFDDRTSTWAIDAAIVAAQATVVTAELTGALVVAPACPGLGFGLAVDAGRRWGYYSTGSDPIADMVRGAGVDDGSVEMVTTGAVVGGSVVAYAHLAILTGEIAAEAATLRQWWGARGTTAARGGVRLAQRGVSSTFRQGEFAGRTIDDVAAGLRSGAINPSQLPLQTITRDGVTYTLNNRSLMALRQAGMEPSVLRDVTGDAFFEGQLTQRLGELGGQVGADFVPIIRGGR